MKVILRFLKPHWKLCVLTILLAAIDVVGASMVVGFFDSCIPH